MKLNIFRGDFSDVSAKKASLPGRGELQMNHLADFITLNIIFNARCLNFGGAGFDSHKKSQPVVWLSAVHIKFRCYMIS